MKSLNLLLKQLFVFGSYKLHGQIGTVLTLEYLHEAKFDLKASDLLISLKSVRPFKYDPVQPEDE